jgi:3',5'-cyclic AMP phosphodiesterase CpdA
MGGMKTRLALGSAFVLLVLYAATKTIPMPEAELHRATAMPDRVILTWAGDPATTQAVTWRTSTAVEKAVAEIALDEDGPGFVKKAKSVEAVSEKLKSDLGEAHYHSVKFTALTPGTQYVYRVGDGANWSEWNQFRTPLDKPAPLTFLYLGDAQNDIWSLWSRLARTAFADVPKADFTIHAGDLVNRSTRDAEWGEWHAAAGWINRSRVAMPVPGNHEYNAPAAGAPRELTPHWRPQFTLPENGLAALPESSFWYDIQGVRFVMLDSNRLHAEQAKWLDELLSRNPQRWTVLTFHHPVFSAAANRDAKEWRAVIQPVIDKHGVDLVLTGHDHTYARSNLVTGLSGQSGKTVYVVSVSGPKMYNLDREPWMMRAAEDTQLYQVIRIDGERLRYESRTARGVLYDSFELKKRKGKANELVNRVPATPEVRRPPAAAAPAEKKAS